jgi:hypothetical protein
MFVTQNTSMELREVSGSRVDEYEHKCILGNPEVGGYTFLRIVDNFVPEHTASHPIREKALP